MQGEKTGMEMGVEAWRWMKEETWAGTRNPERRESANREMEK
jgi:hypothetical protein